MNFPNSISKCVSLPIFIISPNVFFLEFIHNANIVKNPFLVNSMGHAVGLVIVEFVTVAEFVTVGIEQPAVHLSAELGREEL